jgi:hypothetical protein
MHALVLVEHPRGGGLVDLVEALALAADPAAEPAAAMRIMRHDVVAGHRARHRAAQQVPAPIKMRFDGGIELGDEFFDLARKDGHRGDLTFPLSGILGMSPMDKM